MKTLSVEEISRMGISKVVRAAQTEPVLVSRDNEPAVWMVSADAVMRASHAFGPEASVNARIGALIAVHLFDQGVISLGQAASLAEMRLVEFIALCDQLYVPVLRETERGVAQEADRFEQWLASVETGGMTGAGR